MVAYSFKAMFADPILEGTKGGTIRGDRKRHARPGEELQLYTGMRTRQCKLIARRRCIAVEEVELFMGFHPAVHLSRDIDSEIARGDALDVFARFDGFANWEELARFWYDEHGATHFRGWHIRWLPLPAILMEAA